MKRKKRSEGSIGKEEGEKTLKEGCQLEKEVREERVRKDKSET